MMIFNNIDPSINPWSTCYQLPTRCQAIDYYHLSPKVDSVFIPSNAYFIQRRLPQFPVGKAVENGVKSPMKVKASDIHCSSLVPKASHLYKAVKLVKNDLSVVNSCLLFLKDFLAFPVLVNGLQKYMMSSLR